MSGEKRIESWTKPEVDYLDVDEGGVMVVAGRQVPHVRVRRMVSEFEGFRFTVGLQTIDCAIDDAQHIAAMIAESLAVGAGYVGWPDEDREFVKEPFGRVVNMIGSIMFDDGTTESTAPDDPTSS